LHAKGLRLTGLHRNGLDRAIQSTKRTSYTKVRRFQNGISFGIRCLRGVGQAETGHRTGIDTNFARHALVDPNCWPGPRYAKPDPGTNFLVGIQNCGLGTNFTAGIALDAALGYNFVIFALNAFNAVNRAHFFT
jgi:hypothetical protein